MNNNNETLRFSILRNRDLTDELKEEIISVCNAAFPEPFDKLMDFIPPDGIHVTGYTSKGQMASHVLITKRNFVIGDNLNLKCAYIDAVATHPDHQGKGFGSQAMNKAMKTASGDFDIGGLSTFIHRWYGKLGWKEWKGSLFLNKEGEIIPTPEIDGVVMIYEFEKTPPINVHSSLTACWRPGGGW